MFLRGVALELSPQGRLPHGAVEVQGNRMEAGGQNCRPFVVDSLAIAGEDVTGMPEPEQLSLPWRLLGDLVCEFADLRNKPSIDVGLANDIVGKGAHLLAQALKRSDHVQVRSCLTRRIKAGPFQRAESRAAPCPGFLPYFAVLVHCIRLDYLKPSLTSFQQAKS
jgi:hypothetical protein